MSNNDLETKPLDDAEGNAEAEAEQRSKENAVKVEKVVDVLVADISEGEGLGDLLSGPEADEAKAELNERQKEIEKILESKEIKIDPELVKRVLRELGTAKDLQDFVDDNFVEELKKENGKEAVENKLKQLAGMLERRTWGKIFDQLHEGDTVVSFSVPGAEFLSIKNLNDNVFDPSVSDSIIEAKRNKIRDKFAALFPGENLLRTDYKIEVARIPSGAEFSQDDLEKMMAEVDAEMVEKIEELAAEFLKKDDLTEKKRAGVDKFLKQLRGEDGGKKGFRMNYGITQVEGSDSKDKILAVNNAVGTARTARPDSESYGGEYSEEATLAELGSIKELKDEIIEKGNSIADIDGNSFSIFTNNPDGSQSFNRDLLRDVRKGKFKPAAGQEGILKQLVIYTKKLNILDFVKPFVYEDLQTAESNIKEAQGLAGKLREGESLADSERQKIKEILNSDERAPDFTSRMEFDRRATDMAKAAYISMDVLDLGVDLLLEYEQEVEKINNNKNLSESEKIQKFNEASLRAGDKTTDRLKTFWKKVEEVCADEKYNLKGAEGLVAGLVGGDELTLVVEIGDGKGKMSEELVRELIFALKDKTNSRVIETVVANSNRDNTGTTDKMDLAKAHLEAMTRSADGAAILKDIEEVARKLTRVLGNSDSAKVSEAENKLKEFDGLFVIEEGQVKTRAVIVEENGELVITNKDKYKVSYEEIQDKLKAVLGK